MTTNTLAAPKRLYLPAHYASPMSANQKIDFAFAAAEHVRGKGLTPVAASVTGSRLRGVDTSTSDVDVLVLVAEKTEARSMDLPHLGDVEGQVQSLSAYATLLPTSVPYVEFQRSPFMVADPAYRAYLQALRPNWNVLSVHAERFVHHLLGRKTTHPDKRLRTAACVHHLLEGGSPLVPRGYLHRETTPRHVLDWVEEVARAA